MCAADTSEATIEISQVPEQRQPFLSASDRMRLLYILSKRLLFDTTVPVLSSLGRNH